jgi:hypothetical protein
MALGIKIAHADRVLRTSKGMTIVSEGSSPCPTVKSPAVDAPVPPGQFNSFRWNGIGFSFASGSSVGDQTLGEVAMIEGTTSLSALMLGPDVVGSCEISLYNSAGEKTFTLREPVDYRGEFATSNLSKAFGFLLRYRSVESLTQVDGDSAGENENTSHLALLDINETNYSSGKVVVRLSGGWPKGVINQLYIAPFSCFIPADDLEVTFYGATITGHGYMELHVPFVIAE